MIEPVSNSGNNTIYQPLLEESDLSIAIQIIRDAAQRVNFLASSLISLVGDGVDLISGRKYSLGDTESVIASFLTKEDRKSFFKALEVSEADYNTALNNNAGTELKKFREFKECNDLFRYILDNTYLTNEEKLSTIKKELTTIGFSYTYTSSVKDVVEYIKSKDVVEYIKSDERKALLSKKHLAEINFAKALINELNIPSLNDVCNPILNNADISEEKKSQELHNAITAWQNDNPNIVASIEKINLTNKNISFIPTCISGFTNLKWIYLSHNQITDVDGLAGLESLKVLDLAENQIIDISGLAGLVKLQRLDLYHNQITDVDGLAGLVKLQWLDLSHNQITDVDGLAGLESLEFLDLAENQIIDRNSLKIPNCRIYM